MIASTPALNANCDPRAPRRVVISPPAVSQPHCHWPVAERWYGCVALQRLVLLLHGAAQDAPSRSIGDFDDAAASCDRRSLARHPLLTSELVALDAGAAVVVDSHALALDGSVAPRGDALGLVVVERAFRVERLRVGDDELEVGLELVHVAVEAVVHFALHGAKVHGRLDHVEVARHLVWLTGSQKNL